MTGTRRMQLRNTTRPTWALLLIVLAMLYPSCAAFSQSIRQHAAPPSIAGVRQRYEEAGIAWLTQHAAIIFYGQVLAPAPDSVPSASSPVRFQVITGLKGVRDRQTLDFVQGPDATPFHPGERLVLFLHKPNAAHISSPVRRDLGVLRVGGAAMVDTQGMWILGHCLPPDIADRLPPVTPPRHRMDISLHIRGSLAATPATEPLQWVVSRIMTALGALQGDPPSRSNRVWNLAP